MRQIILDTETTGFSEGRDKSEGHRIIELGCVEIIDRQPTTNYFHCYFNPDRPVDTQAFQVHGISDDFLKDKPRFIDKVADIERYFENADEIIAHNMNFDRQFLDTELRLANCGYTLASRFQLVDSLKLARTLFPGAKNSLDALCRRLGIDNTNRTLHGALLDAQLLAEVYLKLTGGQSNLHFDAVNVSVSAEKTHLNLTPQQWKKIEITEAERKAHQKIIASLRN